MPVLMLMWWGQVDACLSGAERPKLYVLLHVSKSSAYSLYSSRNLTELSDSARCAGGAFK